ncbi:hypothetical protein EMCRGX_G011243 [Ephydatia muelleri]
MPTGCALCQRHFTTSSSIDIHLEPPDQAVVSLMCLMNSAVRSPIGGFDLKYICKTFGLSISVQNEVSFDSDPFQPVRTAGCYRFH